MAKKYQNKQPKKTQPKAAIATALPKPLGGLQQSKQNTKTSSKNTRKEKKKKSHRDRRKRREKNTPGTVSNVDTLAKKKQRTLAKSPAITTIRRVTIPKNVQSKKTSYSLNNLHSMTTSSKAKIETLKAI